MSTAPTPAPPGKSNLLLWVLGVFGAAVVLFIVAGLLVGSFFVKNIRVRESGKHVEISTPAGEITVNKRGMKEVGLPIYPGAILVESVGNVELTTPGDDKVGIAVAHYRTPDPLEKVDAWYRAHLGAEFERDESGAKRGKIRVHGVETDGVAYVSDRDDRVRFVAISKKGVGVDVALGRIGKQEPQ